jgi:hypothetical protein
MCGVHNWPPTSFQKQPQNVVRETRTLLFYKIINFTFDFGSPSTSSSFVSIVKPTLRVLQPTISHTIHKPMLIRNQSRPPSHKFMFQRFRLSRPLKRRSRDFINQRIQLFQKRLVLQLPTNIPDPRIHRKRDFHFTRFRTIPLPASGSAMESSRFLALFGLRSKYMVSSCAV